MITFQCEDREQEKVLRSWTWDFLDYGTSCLLSGMLIWQLSDTFLKWSFWPCLFAAVVTAYSIEDVEYAYNHEFIQEIAGENATMDADQGF